MIHVIKENQAIFFLFSASNIYVSETDTDFFYLPDNLPFWKMRGSKGAVMANSGGLRERDLLKYETLFRGELTIKKAYETIIPKMKKILEKYGRLNEDKHFIDTYFIAKDHQIMKISPKGECTWVKSIDTSKSSFLEWLLVTAEINKDKHPMIRLALGEKIINDYFRIVTYPIGIVDANTLRVQYIRSEEELWALESLLKKKV